jgi:hypothetical protein
MQVKKNQLSMNEPARTFIVINSATDNTTTRMVKPSTPTTHLPTPEPAGFLRQHQEYNKRLTRYSFDSVGGGYRGL